MKIYYKVVNLPDLGSARTFGEENLRKRVYYKVNEWVDAPITDGQKTKLFVFSDYNDAKNFLINNEIIYECICKGVIQHPACNDKYNLKAFWSLINQSLCKKKKVNIKNLIGCFSEMTSTYIASSVKLLKKL